ncbi:hypothetical protein BROSI_A0559 [Candidatus Brocadia sinica JPN1]|uniref:Uncharacterized protein n=1 Tax=Candidatus Brocadia sinica JPN1 TaxID=1197129 RepID=A0ABQ0JTL4_9BACT|nr:hypothetical protein BROSI_A0559 [Candidatus Brocadia sinica JPN1]GJQ17799.1 MAG: hypothetical protein HBSIN01_17580 [Candidatus Brocadia sinica]
MDCDFRRKFVFWVCSKGRNSTRNHANSRWEQGKWPQKFQIGEQSGHVFVDPVVITKDDIYYYYNETAEGDLQARKGYFISIRLKW